MYYYLPIMPLFQALLHKDLSFITLNFKTYPNMKVMAQNFPRILRYARKTILNCESSFCAYNKVTSVPYYFIIVHSLTPKFFIFEEIEPVPQTLSEQPSVTSPTQTIPSLVVESPNSATDVSHTPSSQIVEYVNPTIIDPAQSSPIHIP